ncbi:MAG: YfhO family protein [Candidatus Promineifilaceae bacterium]|nr:YfhO family protein [Candidatus Promineifilaceae bacterium]
MLTYHAHTHSRSSLPHYIKTYWRGDFLSLLLLALATLIFFGPVVIGQAWIPRGGGDSVSFIYPMYRFASQNLWSGTIPLWNPYQYAGTPFITDNQSGIFYPFNLLLFLMNPNFSYRAIQGLIIWHFFFAGAAMFFCARLLSRTRPVWRPAALVGSLAFMFSSLFITHIGNLNLIAVAAWLPLVFLMFHRSISADEQKGRLAWAAASGAAFGIGTLAGHGQMTFLLATYLVFYALFQSISRKSLRPFALLAVLGGVAIAVSAINLFPSFEAVQYTVRAGFNSDQAANYSLPWRGVLGILAPDFFGRGEVRFWGSWSRVEYGYVGVLTLLLASVALVKRRTPLTYFFALSALLFLLLALGANTPLYPFLIRVLPWFPFQVPARFVLLVDFSLAALAITGANSLFNSPELSKSFFIGSGIAIIVALLILFWQYAINIQEVPHHQQQIILAMVTFAIFAGSSWLLLLAYNRGVLSASLFGALAIILLSVDLISLGRNVELELGSPMPGFAQDSPALAYLQSDPGLHRIDIATGKWQPNLPQMEQLYSIRGVYNPLELSNYAAYIGSVGYRGSPLYNLLGTKYVIGGKNSPPADTNIIVPVFDEDPDVTVFLNTLALPRVNVIYNAISVENQQAAFEAIHQENFDPLETIIVEKGQDLKQVPGQPAVTLLRYDPNALAFEVNTDKPAYFLISDIYHPHWKAAVNGREVPILPADYALRAVEIEPGSNLIEMWFAPPGWTWGLIVSAMAWIFLMIIAVAALWRNRRPAISQA